MPELSATRDGSIANPGQTMATHGTNANRAIASTSCRIHLSEAAIVAVRDLLEDEELLPEGGLRISAHFGAGCATPLRYDLILEPEAEPDDVILSGEEVRVFVDPKSVWVLDGLRVDYVDSPEMGSGFAFQHPRGMKGRAGTCDGG